jgi:hypothetical protein
MLKNAFSSGRSEMAREFKALIQSTVQWQAQYSGIVPKRLHRRLTLITPR